MDLLFLGPGQIEPWLALSRNGVLGGFLWQFLTYPFLGELDTPLGSMCLVIALMSIGRELENAGFFAKHDKKPGVS